MFRASMLSFGLLLCVCVAGLQAGDSFKPDEEGYIRNWLVLAPIPMPDGQSGVDGNAKEQLKDEAKLKPKEGDKATAAGKDLVWKKYQAKESFGDFNDFLGAITENSVGYFVTYLNVPDEMTGLKLKMGSDDQAKVYLNGKAVLTNDTPRPLTVDEDTAEGITLKKGINVLVFKVVNESFEWKGSIRFLDKDDKPVRNYRVAVRGE